MKKTLALSLGALAMLAGGLAAEAGEHPRQAAPSISGLWREISTPTHRRSTVIFSQANSKVFAACYWEYQGKKVVWHAAGARRGDKVVYTLLHTRAPKKWDAVGRHELTLSADGRTLSGRWSNTRNESGPLKFVRVK